MSTNHKVIIVGWDGATFDIIQPLIEQGRLPNVAAIMQSGVWAPLKSTIPPLTPAAWTSIFTGVNPGKHGILDAFICLPRERTMSFVNASMRRAPAVWSLLNERGKTTGVLSVPVTYPPEHLNGFMITGMFTPQTARERWYPPELMDEINRNAGPYRDECRQSSDPKKYLQALLSAVDDQERAALYLMDARPTDFLFVTFVTTDRVQHFFWKYLDPSHAEHSLHGGAVAAVYERLDQTLGRLLERAGPDAHVMIVSDHGAGPLRTAFFLNNWLMKAGYLRLNNDAVKQFEASRPGAVTKFMRKALARILPPAVSSRLAFISAKPELNMFLSLIDWKNTVAFSEGVAGGVFLNPDAVPPQDRPAIVEKLIRELLDIKGPGGAKVFEQVSRREDVYHGPETAKAADIILTCSAGYQIIAPNELIFFGRKYGGDMFMPHRWSGRHEPYGVFMARGPAIAARGRIADRSVTDVAPLSLYLMGEPIPRSMDGRVPEEAIAPAYLRDHEIRFTESVSTGSAGGGPKAELSGDEEKEIADRLRNLGYME